ADHGDLQPVPDLELSDQLDHFRAGFRLRAHEAPELSPGERALFVEDDSTQVFLESELSLFVGFERQAMPLFHLGPIQLEVCCRPSAENVIPTVAEQHTADIEEERGDAHFHDTAS